MRKTLPGVRFAAFLAVAITALPVGAAVFTVTRFDDGNDGACNADCTLREAVIAANASGGADTILLDAGSYDLTIPDASAGVDEDAAATGDLDIWAGGLAIQGLSASQVTIDATGLGNRIFHVLRQFSSSPVLIQGVTLEGGDSSSLGLTKGGGSAIRIDESFSGFVATLDDVVIDKNAGSSAVRSAATLHISDCTFSENAVDAALELKTSGQNKAGSSATQIQRTTFRENDGFAITSVRNEDKIHQFELSNSTLSANSATPASSSDAAIYTTNSAKLWNVTIADDGGYGLAAITDFFGTPVVEVQSSIFSGNTFGSVTPSGAIDGAVLPVSSGGNVLSDGGAGAFGLASDHVDTNPKLLPLSNNGGNTLTYGLDPTSPAIDAGLNAGPIANCPTLDQRDQPRPQDGDGNGVAICDAGAVEVPEPGAAWLALAAFAALAARPRRRS